MALGFDVSMEIGCQKRVRFSTGSSLRTGWWRGDVQVKRGSFLIVVTGVSEIEWPNVAKTCSQFLLFKQGTVCRANLDQVNYVTGGFLGSVRRGEWRASIAFLTQNLLFRPTQRSRSSARPS
jgi:hypothetical protein